VIGTSPRGPFTIVEGLTRLSVLASKWEQREPVPPQHMPPLRTRADGNSLVVFLASPLATELRSPPGTRRAVAHSQVEQPGRRGPRVPRMCASGPARALRGHVTEPAVP